MNYWVWGPRDHTGEGVIVLGGNEDNLRQGFQIVVKVADLNHPYAMPYENRPVWHCRGAKCDLRTL